MRIPVSKTNCFIENVNKIKDRSYFQKHVYESSQLLRNHLRYNTKQFSNPLPLISLFNSIVPSTLNYA